MPKISTLPVYIISTTDKQEPAHKVSRIFDDDFFDVSIIEVKPPVNLPVSNGMKKEDAETNYQWTQVLTQSLMNHPDDPVLVISETSITNANPESIAEVLMAILNDESNYDMIYLGGWLDKSTEYFDTHHLKLKNPDGSEIELPTLISKTKAPCGLQSILFSSETRKIILGKKPLKHNELKKKDQYFSPLVKSLSHQIRDYTRSGHFTVGTVVPNLFDYDISYAEKPSDYLKLNKFSVVSTTSEIQSKALPLIWFILIALVVVVLLWIAYKFSK